MPKQSAGILVYRLKTVPEILLVHPGGPFFMRKDAGVWSVPKGEYSANEDPFQVALREFKEETGNILKGGNFIELEPVKIKSGKVIRLWAVEADFERPFIRSDEFELEWPPGSGKMQLFPETDRAEWFTLPDAKDKISPGQLPFIEQLAAVLCL